MILNPLAAAGFFVVGFVSGSLSDPDPDPDPDPPEVEPEPEPDPEPGSSGSSSCWGTSGVSEGSGAAEMLGAGAIADGLALGRAVVPACWRSVAALVTLGW